MNQEKELLEQVKEQYAKEQGYKSHSDFMWCIQHGFSDRYTAITLLESFNTEVSQRYANELLKLRLGEVREEIKSKKFSPKDDTVIVHNGALSLAIEIINEKLDQ